MASPSSKAPKAEFETLSFPSQADFEAWLEAHGTTSDGLWVQFAKKDSGITSVTYPEAVESALCFGWIDGQRKPLDAQYFLQRYTPRGARSRWSQINRDRVLALIEAGRVRPPGVAEVERAQADGRWDAAYASARTITVPDDFEAALAANEAARAFFATLTGSNRYAVLYRIEDAKRADTRARRIAQFVDMLAEGKTVF